MGRHAPDGITTSTRVEVLATAAATGAVPLLGLPLLLAPALATAVWTLMVLTLRRRRDRAASRRRDQVTESVEAMLGELRAGQPPGRALERAAQPWPDLAAAAAAHRLGADVPSRLRDAAMLPGARAAEQVAAAWELCGASGVSLADALEQVLVTARAEHEVASAVTAELGSARATVRLLAVLPVLVLSMGTGVGADPWRFLVSTPSGQMCLWLGVTLMSVGVMWLERIADYAQGGSR